MNIKKRYILIVAMLLIAGVALVAVTAAMSGTANAPLAPGASLRAAQGGAPSVVAYQGEVQVAGEPYTGAGYFKFAVVNAAGDASYWSNDGTSTGGLVPADSVELAVGDGLFSVLLGDAMPGMTQSLTAGVFDQPDRYLRVWFSTSVGGPFDLLAPDTRVAAVPYALQAEKVASTQNVVIVAKSGGDYTGVQAAIDSISDAAADNAYLVWVAPGVYSETVTMKPYVHLQGAGQEATVISSTASSSGEWPPTQATLVLASDVSLRDLTVNNGGAGDLNAALLATAGVTRTLAADVTTQALGDGEGNYAIFLSGSGTSVTLQRVTGLAENGSSHNLGLVNFDGTAAVLRGGDYTGRGGATTRGILTLGSGTTLEAENVTALGENGSELNSGLSNYGGAVAVLRGGDFAGRGGITQAAGIVNSVGSTLTAQDITVLAENGAENYALGNYSAATMTVRVATVIARGGGNNYALSNEDNVTMDAESVTALAEDGSGTNYGLWNVNGAAATLRGGSFTGHGGVDAWGMYSDGITTTLEAESVIALGEDGSSGNNGLGNNSGAEATLRGGSFTARGEGADTCGIYNSGIGTEMEAESVTALAEGSDYSFGLVNYISATATLRGGSFTGRGGTFAHGISNNGISTTLEAESITALGENGSSDNHGLLNIDSAEATLRGGSFIGRGAIAHGILNSGALDAESITALGEDGTSANYGLYNIDTAANVTQSVLEGATNSVYRESGSVTVSNSRLVYIVNDNANVTCVLVSRGTSISTNGSDCP